MNKYAPSVVRVMVMLGIFHVAFHGENPAFSEMILMAVLIMSLKLTDIIDE